MDRKLIILFAVLIMLPTAVHAYNYTNVQLMSTIYGYINDFDVGDIDKDGDLDVAFLDNGGDIYWKSQTGNNTGTFSGETWVYTISDAWEQKNQIFLRDFENDGDLDIAAVEWGINQNVRIFRFRNNGAGTFTQLTTLDAGMTGGDFGTPYLHKPVRVEDVNADNNMDFIISTNQYEYGQPYTAATKVIYSGTTTVTVSSTYGQDDGLTIGDVDNDGRKDILLSYASNPDVYPQTYQLMWYKNNGGTSWVASPNIVDTRYTANLLIIDWNLDSRNDILSVFDWNSYNDDGWYEKLVNGSWERHTDIPAPGTSRSVAYSIQAVDMNNDTIKDLVLHDPFIYEWGGVSETWGTQTDILGMGLTPLVYPAGGTKSYAVDINKDGDMDIVYNTRYTANRLGLLQSNDVQPPVPPNQMPVLTNVLVSNTTQFINYPINFTGVGTDNESNTLYSAIDCNYPTAAPAFSIGLFKQCTYVTPGNYTARYYLTDDAHPLNYSVYLDRNVEAIANYLPTINSVIVQHSSPLINHQIYVIATATDPESNTLYYGIDCDYHIGDPNPTYDTTATKYCTYGTPGAVTIRYYVTDSEHPTDYSVYQDTGITVLANPPPTRWDTFYLWAIMSTGMTTDSQFVKAGNYIYQSTYNYNGNVQVFNVTDPLKLANLGQWSTPSSNYVGAIAKAGDYAIIASNNYLHVVDVSNPTNPHNVLNDTNTSWANMKGGASYGNRYIYISTDAGLYTIDTATLPSTLTVTSSILSGTRRLRVFGDYLYTGSGRIYSLANPASPTLLSSSMIGGNNNDVTVVNNTAFVLNYVGTYPPGCSIYAYDITNKSSPTQITRWDSNPGYRNNFCGHSIASTVSDDGKTYLFHTSNYYLFVTEVTDPFNYYLQTIYTVPSMNGGDQIYAEGDYVYISSMGDDKFRILSDIPPGNQYPTINSITPSDTTPNLNQSITVTISATDLESDTMYYAIDCAWHAGDPNGTYDGNSVKTCTYDTKGAYKIRAWVTDSNHTVNDYNNYIQTNVYVLGTPDFFESFGTSSWTSGTVDNGYSRVRTASWLNSKPTFTGGNWDNTWRRWGTDNSGSWSLNPESDVRIPTPMGYSMYQYNSPWNNGVYHGISYVFPSQITFGDDDYLSFSCAFPTERVTGNIGRVEDNIIFKKADGTGGFCIQFDWFTTCSLSDNDAWMGCNSAYNTVCIAMTQYCGGWDGTNYHDASANVTLRLSDYVDQAHRTDISIMEMANRAGGGGWSEPRAYGAIFDDIALSYTATLTCGDTICTRPDENIQNCPADCPSICGDSICVTPGENYQTCDVDCDSFCGDSVCNVYVENYNTCGIDCPYTGNSGSGSTPDDSLVPCTSGDCYIEPPPYDWIDDSDRKINESFSFNKYRYYYIMPIGDTKFDDIRVRNHVPNQTVRLSFSINEQLTDPTAKDWVKFTFNGREYSEIGAVNLPPASFFSPYKYIPFKVTVPDLVEMRKYAIVYNVRDHYGYTRQLTYIINTGDDLWFNKIWYWLNNPLWTWRLNLCLDLTKLFSGEMCEQTIIIIAPTPLHLLFLLIVILVIQGAIRNRIANARKKRKKWST